MSGHHYYEIRRDGLISAFGRFMAEPGRQKALRDNYDFVRCQLKHYGVQFEESQFSGNGTALMKAALQAGKCDQVPDHILKLQEQKHAKWLSGQTPEQLSSDPDWVMQKYFLSAGQPDRTKTTTVVGIPFHRYSEYRSGQMIEAASKVPRLTHKRAVGRKTQFIFMGWDRAAVEKAANQHPAEEARRLQNEKDERESAREKLHMDYRNSRRRQNKDASPVGSYIVDCEVIEREWPDTTKDLGIDIHRTITPGIFKADFDFGVLKGVMIISSDKATLNKYCREADGDYDEETDEDSVLVEKNSKTGTKRGPPASRPRGRPKKNKTGQDQPHKYQLKLKCRETGEGMIYCTAFNGTIDFEDKSLASFKGEADFPVWVRRYRTLHARFLILLVHLGTSGRTIRRVNTRWNGSADGAEFHPCV